VVARRLYRTRTEDIDESAVATRYAANGDTGIFGAETVICTTGIGGTFQTGSTSVYGRANCTAIPTGVIAVVRVRRHPRLGGARSCEQAQDAWPSNRDHALRDGVEVSFRRKSQYLLNDGQIKW
jgi:hypothetical protein